MFISGKIKPRHALDAARTKQIAGRLGNEQKAGRARGLKTWKRYKFLNLL